VAEPIRYYHGGPDGLTEILPPVKTGALSTSEVGPRALRERAARVHSRDRVYVTQNFTAAALFAAGHRTSVVYEVTPIGALEDDPDCDERGLSFACERAEIVKAHKLSAQDVAQIRSVLFSQEVPHAL
jgi:hypothetical protein